MFSINYHNRKKLDFINIIKEYERLSTLQECNVLKWSEIYDAIEYFKLNGYDIISDYKCIYEDSDDEEYNINKTVDIIRERLQQVFLLSE